MLKILVTAGKGQVGQVLQSMAHKFREIEFTFFDSTSLDITCLNQVKQVLTQDKWDYCINLAAYTQVDNAEVETDQAYQVNSIGVENLAKCAHEFGITLLHLSTDFVFDGAKKSPYTITDIPHPLNVYGSSKLQGEKNIERHCNKYYIIRTSWLYSDFGQNFKKTMLHLAKTRSSISVVNDQVGTPTNAIDLCNYMIEIIESKPRYGLYHFAGNKVCSWYDFAKDIFKANNIDIEVLPISSKDFNSRANRPSYSALATTPIS